MTNLHRCIVNMPDETWKEFKKIAIDRDLSFEGLVNAVLLDYMKKASR